MTSVDYKPLITDIKKYGDFLPYTCIILINMVKDQIHINDILMKAITNILLVMKCRFILVTSNSKPQIQELIKLNVPVFISDKDVTQAPRENVGRDQNDTIHSLMNFVMGNRKRQLGWHVLIHLTNFEGSNENYVSRISSLAGSRLLVYLNVRLSINNKNMLIGLEAEPEPAKVMTHLPKLYLLKKNLIIRHMEDLAQRKSYKSLAFFHSL